MDGAFTDILIIFISVFTLVLASVITIIVLYTSKKTRYDAELNAIRLDATRKSLESDIRAMYDSIYRDQSRWPELNHLILDSIRNQDEVSRPSDSEKIINPDRFLNSLGIFLNDLKVDQRSVFILTPLNDEEYKASNVIKFACSELGLYATRGDEENINGPILPSIIRAISQAKVVVANINGRNPNVMYELGVAQALGKDVIVVSKRHSDEIPFDVRQQRLVLYDSLKDLSAKLKISISQIALGVHMNS